MPGAVGQERERAGEVGAGQRGTVGRLKTAIVAALLAVLLLAGPAGAQERACRGQIGPPKSPRIAERERLDGYVAHRKIFRFRTDLRHVRALVRSGGPWDEFL